MENKKSYIYMIVASLSFATMGAVVKYSGKTIPLMQQLFVRNLLMVFFSYFMLKKSNLSIKTDRKNYLTLFLRSIFGFLGMICLFYASRVMPLSNAQILQKLYPFFIVILSYPVLKEIPKKGSVYAAIIAFIGAFIVINPAGNYNIEASLIALLAAVFSAMAYISIRKLSGKVNGLLVIFYFSLISTLISFPLMLMDIIIPNIFQISSLVLIACCAASGQYFLTKAYLGAQASFVSVFDYTGIIFSVFLGTIIFNDAITVRSSIGIILIIIAGLINIYSKNKK